MDINGYELGSIAHMTSGGPLWSTTAPAGQRALLALRSSDEGERCVDRWRTWAAIDSSNVVGLIDVVRHRDGRWAIVMERIEGRPLDVLLGTDFLRMRETRERVARGIRAGLDSIHGAGMVHGDLSPANIIVTPQGRPVIIDLIDEAPPGAGTAQWSLSDEKNQHSDREACERICRAIDSTAEPNALAPVADDDGDDEVIAVMRRVAHRATTTVPVTHHRRQRASMWGVAVLALVICTAGAAVLLSMSDASNAESAGGGSPSVSGECPSVEEAQSRLEEIMATRDRAFLAADPEVLDGYVGEALADQDRARMKDLADTGITISSLSTRVVGVDEPACSAQTTVVRSRLEVDELVTCSAAGCSVQSPGEAVILDIVFASGSWIALDARGVD
ncbi:protein kinase domain-containing protein [Actinomyces mediterranea]|uniref:protein kinase domain-containing protein n=1 Tax=Actinomyces mediterranea TaxID=1871028 RepID=UPI0009710BDF|nr:RIO1 family regulatory kinase/ATPase [Actinomyces mediterranea]